MDLRDEENFREVLKWTLKLRDVAVALLDFAIVESNVEELSLPDVILLKILCLRRFDETS